MKKYRLTKERKAFIKENIKYTLITIAIIIILSLPDAITGLV